MNSLRASKSKGIQFRYKWLKIMFELRVICRLTRTKSNNHYQLLNCSLELFNFYAMRISLYRLFHAAVDNWIYIFAAFIAKRAEHEKVLKCASLLVICWIFNYHCELRRYRSADVVNHWLWRQFFQSSAHNPIQPMTIRFISSWLLKVKKKTFSTKKNFYDSWLELVSRL